MEPEKMGCLIRSLRQERGLTQQQLAQQLHVSDKAVSKWERGAGCPDASLLSGLAAALGITLEQLLQGRLPDVAPEGGNMKRTKLYRCPVCGNLLLSVGKAEISCCGRPLEPMKAQAADEAHQVKLETVEDELYATFSHPMEKEHYVCFLAVIGWERAVLVRLYPEQGGEARLPRVPGGKVYLCCSEHGLYMQR